MIEAIGYPDRAPDGALSFALRVDGAEIHAEEADGRLLLCYAISDDESILPALAQYATGRMLREGATLSFGEPGLSAPQPQRGAAPSAFLWQEAPAGASAGELRRLFEKFMDSCDWWRERVAALRGHDAPGAGDGDTMVIRP